MLHHLTFTTCNHQLKVWTTGGSTAPQLLSNTTETTLRNLWFVADMLINSSRIIQMTKTLWPQHSGVCSLQWVRTLQKLNPDLSDGAVQTKFLLAASEADVDASHRSPLSSELTADSDDSVLLGGETLMLLIQQIHTKPTKWRSWLSWFCSQTPARRQVSSAS